jgi:hypothetical protein
MSIAFSKRLRLITFQVAMWSHFDGGLQPKSTVEGR